MKTEKWRNKMFFFIGIFITCLSLYGCGGGGGKDIEAPKPSESLPISSIQITQIAFQSSDNVKWTSTFNSGSSTSQDVEIDNGEKISVFVDIEGDEVLTTLGRGVKLSVSGELYKSDGTTKIKDVTFTPSELSTTINVWALSDVGIFSFTSTDALDVEELPVYLRLTWTISKLIEVPDVAVKFRTEWTLVANTVTIQKVVPKTGAPSVSFSEPKNGWYVLKSNNINVAAFAISSIGIKTVWFEVDGQFKNYMSASGQTYNATWDASSSSSGTHILTVRAKDKNGTPGDATITMELVDLGTSHTDYDTIIVKYANQFNVHPALIKGMIEVESNFDPNAESSRKAKGLMQLKDSIAAYYGVTDSFDEDQNIRGGTNFFSDLFNKYIGKAGGGLEAIKFALSAYNAGEPTFNSAWEAAGKPGDWETVKPYLPEETQKHVQKVLSAAANYGF